MPMPIKQVYLIDDDAMSNMIHSRLMGKHHWQSEALIFKDGPSALRALEQAAHSGEGWPQVILLDMEMPAFDGWDFLSEYAQLPKSNTSRCLLYLLSSSINPHDISKAKTYPWVKAYLTKPLTLASLTQIEQDHQSLPE